MKHPLFTYIISLLLIPLSAAQDPFGDPDFLGEESIATVYPEVSSVDAGGFFKVAFTLDLKPKYHAYWKSAGTTGLPPSVEWDLPEGFTAGELQFPIPKAFRSSSTGVEAVSYGYADQNTFVTEIKVSEGLPAGQDFEIGGTFSWQECDETCVYQDKPFDFKVTVGEDTMIDENREIFEKVSDQLPVDGSAWAFEASERANLITLEVLFPKAIEVSEPIYFFSSDQQVDSQAPQKVSIEDGKILLTLKRNQGNKEVYIQPGEVKESLSGLLVFNDEGQRSSIEISTPLISDGEAGSKNAEGAEELAFVPATEQDREEGARYYDPDARPEVVTLGGAKEEDVTFFSGLGLLFIGGLLLNLMPCVFPVLGLKVMGFVAQAGEEEKKIKIHGLVFGLGLLIAMWILAAFVISLDIKWGDQLGNPVFLGTMIIFFVLMGLNLYGVFEIGTKLTSVGGEIQGKKGYSGSFFSGVLTTLVATPCSGPFLGAAMAFALALPPAEAFVAFTVFGLGIASPYILLAFFPALIKKLPRPGPWMVSFKQIMSFLLFATAIFFMRAFSKVVGDSQFNMFLFALLLISLGAFIYGRWGVPGVSKGKRYVAGYALAGLFVFGGVKWAHTTTLPVEEPDVAWHEWYPGIFERGRAEGRIVWVDYTADT